MRGAVLGRVAVAVATVVAILVQAPPSAAFSLTQYRWARGQDSLACGTNSVPFKTCYVRFVYTGTVTALKWDGAFRAGAYAWCKFPDPDHGNANDMCYEDYTQSGGLGSADGVAMDARDFAAPNASGGITLGQATWYGYCDPSTAYNCVMTHVDGVLNTNAWLTSGAKNNWSGCAGIPRWYTGTSTTTSGCQYNMISSASHELGHSWGGNHPVRYGRYVSDSALACILSPGVTARPVADDGNGLRWTYGGRNSARWGTPQTAPC